jgi:hypothetical protein
MYLPNQRIFKILCYFSNNFSRKFSPKFFLSTKTSHKELKKNSLSNHVKLLFPILSKDGNINFYFRLSSPAGKDLARYYNQVITNFMSKEFNENPQFNQPMLLEDRKLSSSYLFYNFSYVFKRFEVK